MEKKSYRVLKCLIFTVSILQFTSCQKNYQKVDSIQLSSGDKKLLVQWDVSSGEPSDLEIDISPLPVNYPAEKYPFRLGRTNGLNFSVFDNLDPDVTYTISLSCYDDKGKQISHVQKECRPNGEDAVLEYKENDCQPYVKVPGNVSFVDLKGVNGKRITYANLNPTDKYIDQNYLRMPIYSFALGNKDSRTASPQRNNASVDEQKKFLTAPSFLSEMTPKEYESKLNSMSRSAVSSSYIAPKSYDYKHAKIGDTRELYLDNNIDFFLKDNITLVERKSVTLRAIGKKDGKTICFIWVEDSCFTEENCEGKQINEELAQNFAEIFTDYYLHETDILGSESNFFEGEEELSFEKYSPTGEILNIVFYDLADDYGKNSSVNYNGYFFGRDYWYDQYYSNRGKYIYIDVPSCNVHVDDNNVVTYGGNKDKNGKDVPSGVICSTIFHEFQHMIHYGNKHGKSSTWYNEMLSLLTEDMFNKDLVENYNLNPLDGPFGRLGAFLVNNINNWSGDRTGWNSDVESSYAKAYFFGAWLVRTYGGMQLVHEMSNSEEIDFVSVINSIKKVTDEDITEEELMRQFMLATVFCDTKEGEKEGFATRHNLPTFNTTSGEPITSYGHTSSFEPMDIFSSENKWRVCFQDGTENVLCGPLRCYIYSDLIVPFAPRTFFVREGLLADADEELIIIEKQKDSNEEFYVFVQDEYEYIIE